MGNAESHPPPPLSPWQACLPEDPPCGALGLTCREQCWRSQEDQRVHISWEDAPRACPSQLLLPALGKSPGALTLTLHVAQAALGLWAGWHTASHSSREEEELSELHLQTARERTVWLNAPSSSALSPGHVLMALAIC